MASQRNRQLDCPNHATVAVTGATGALGSALVSELARRGYRVRAIDIRLDAIQERVLGVEYFQHDLASDDKPLAQILSGAQVVYHCAALHGKDLSSVSHDAFFTNNILSSFNVLSACETALCGRIVATSSTSIYGASRNEAEMAIWYDERSTPHCTDVYDRTKLVTERLCADAARRGCPAVAVSLRAARFFVGDVDDHNVRKLYRDVDLRDVVAAHLLAGTADLSPGHHVFNIASENHFSRSQAELLFRDPVRAISKQFPAVSKAAHELGWNLPDCIDRIYDIGRAKAVLGYQPAYTFGSFLRSKAKQTLEREQHQ